MIGYFQTLSLGLEYINKLSDLLPGATGISA